METALVLLLAVLLDRCFGEPRRFHPLIGFGKLAQWTERKLNGAPPAQNAGIITRLKGVVATVALITPFVCIAYVADQFLVSAWHLIFDVLILYIAIAARSLAEHARAVAAKIDDLPKAREAVSMIVSRETSSMREVDVLRAAIESVLENGSDAIFGALFWYALCGAPGVVLYRLANTLDAMWGYKNEQFLYFGWAAARLDDVLSYIPARLTAATYTLLGNIEVAWQCWQTQGPLWYSPNAGPVMAAGAGALELELGGPAIYHGALKSRPQLGQGRPPEARDIERSVRLVNSGIWLWIGITFIIGCLAYA
jgi:adenosylcobinamide-phosphate synthase